MDSRKQKLQQLFEDFQVIKKSLVFPKLEQRAGQITASQWMVLRLISLHNEITAKELARNLSITSSAATQLIDGLVKAGYVKRKESREDRRLVLLSLSPKTKKQVLIMKKKALLQMLNLFKVLTDKEFDQYISLNKKIVDRLVKRV